MRRSSAGAMTTNGKTPTKPNAGPDKRKGQASAGDTYETIGSRPGKPGQPGMMNIKPLTDVHVITPASIRIPVIALDIGWALPESRFVANAGEQNCISSVCDASGQAVSGRFDIYLALDYCVRVQTYVTGVKHGEQRMKVVSQLQAGQRHKGTLTDLQYARTISHLL